MKKIKNSAQLKKKKKKEVEEWKLCQWAYKEVNQCAYEIGYIKDNEFIHFLDGIDDIGITTEKEIAKYLVDLHNESSQWYRDYRKAQKDD